MIYYIIAQDKTSYDEYVVSSHATAYEATQALDFTRKTTGEVHLNYRVDVARSAEEKAAEAQAHAETVEARRAEWKRQVKLQLNRQYGRYRPSNDYNEMLITQAGGDGDTAPRTEDFTLAELFPSPQNLIVYGNIVGMTCTECGALATDISRHLDWHNKLLP